jgi:hypothetical protein
MENCMDGLKQKLYEGLVSLELVDPSTPVENFTGERLWEIANDHIEYLRSVAEQEFGDITWSEEMVKQ